nr:ribonuclease H-like domain-containing protein [Tanacetum cinerariifolium]
MASFLYVTVNTKFLNCLQHEWLKYVNQVLLARRLTEDSYDDLFDYLQQFKKLVNASRAKKLEKSHDPLALVAHTGSFSRTISHYYVTHPSSMVDYDDDYQGDTIQDTSQDPLTSEMILLARAITERFSNPTNIVFDEAGVIQTDKQNDFVFADASRMEEIEELCVNICLMVRIQPIKFDSNEGPSYNSAFVTEVFEMTNDNSLQDEIEKIQRDSSEIQEGIQKRINILENDVQRCQKQTLEFELQLQHEKERRKCESSLKTVCETSWISKMEKLESENVSLEFQVQCLIKERDNVKTEYQKLFDSIKKTQTQTQREINELIENVNQKTYAYADVRAQNQELLITISELKAKLKDVENGLRATSIVRRQSNRDSSFKNSILFNTKNSSKKIEVSDRKNKTSDVASKNVVIDKKIVTTDDIKNALIANNVLCVSCAKIMLIPYCEHFVLAVLTLSQQHYPTTSTCTSSKDDSEGEPMTAHKASSFVQTSKHVKTPRPSIQPVKHPILASNLKTVIPKPKGHNTECIVLSPEFKLPDENQVLLRVLRENNMYNVDLKNIVPFRDLTCFFCQGVKGLTTGIKSRYQSGEGYHSVSPPYTGTFMSPKPDLVFHNAPTMNETVSTAFNVELSPT